MGSVSPKPLLEIAGRSIASRVLDRFRGHVDRILVSTNDPRSFAVLGYETVQDRVGGFEGPLAGLDAAMAHLEAEKTGPFRILSLPGDTPFLPSDLAVRLLEGSQDGQIAVAEFAGRLQPATALWPASSLLGLAAQLATPGAPRSLLSQIERFPYRTVSFARDSMAPDGDPFFNINTPEDFKRAARHLNSLE